MTIPVFSLPADLSKYGDFSNRLKWPVSLLELNEFRDRLVRRWFEIVGPSPLRDRKRYMILSALGMATGRAMLVFEISAAFQRGDNVSVDGAAPFVQAIVTGGASPVLKTDTKNMLTSLSVAPWRKIANAAASYLPNSHRRSVYSINTTDTVIIGSCGLISAHKKITDEEIVYCNFDHFADAAMPHLGVGELNQELIDEVIAAAVSVSNEMGVDLLPAAIQYLRDLIATTARTYDAFQTALHKSRVKLPRRVWLVSPLGPIASMMGVSVRCEGGEVVAHDHGTGEGWSDLPVGSLFDLELADRLVTFSQASAEGYRNGLKAMPCLMAGDCAIDFAEMALTPPIKSRASVTNRVLILATAYRTDLMTINPFPHGLIYASWHAQLVKSLEDKGYIVTVRHHPEDRTPIIFPGMPNPSPPLKQQLTESDIVIVDCPQTSALLEALRSNKKVVVLDCGSGRFSLLARSDLARRAALVKVEFDDANRIEVNFNSLFDAMDRLPEPGDRSYLNRWFGDLL